MQVKLITSDSKVLLDKKIKEIIGKSEVVIKYNMEECSLADILEEASYVSLFDEMKYVVVKNADIFGKKKFTEFHGKNVNIGEKATININPKYV